MYTFSILVSTKEGRKDAVGYQTYKVRHRIDGLTEEQAEGLFEAFHGRLTPTNRVDMTAEKQDGGVLSTRKVGDTFHSSN